MTEMAILAIATGFHRDVAASFRERHRIGEQVAQDLTQPLLVGDDRIGRRLDAGDELILFSFMRSARLSPALRITAARSTSVRLSTKSPLSIAARSRMSLTCSSSVPDERRIWSVYSRWTLAQRPGPRPRRSIVQSR